MDSDSHMQPELSHHLPHGISPQLLNDSLLRSTLCHYESQNGSIIGVPVFPSLQEEPYKGLHSDRNSGRYDEVFNRSSLNSHELCLGGSSLASTSMNIPLQQVVPFESLKDMFPTSYSYASGSSIPTVPNYAYDSLVGDSNWDQNRCLIQPELGWRSSTSELEPLQFTQGQNSSLWMLPSSANECSNTPYETSVSHNELSLSLSTFRPSLPCSSSMQVCGGPNMKGHNELSLGCCSNSQPTQLSQTIPVSRYLNVLKQIFSDMASYSLATVDQTSMSTGLASSNSSHMFSPNQMNNPGGSFKRTRDLCGDDPSDSVECSYQEVELKKSRLLSLLQVVDEFYNRSLDEIHTVLAAFRAASELEPQVLACFAIRTISFFYKNLRERICNEILAMGLSSTGITGDNDSKRSAEHCLIQKHWALQQLKKKDQHLWRPQRGLPERSVSVLRAWMFDNFLHPYPKDSEKHLLAIKSGLTRSQVSNWFINARVRLWKPLVEEMCAEMNRRNGAHQRDEVANYNDHRSQLSIYDHNHRFNT